MSIRFSPTEAWEFVRHSHTGILTTLRRDGAPISLPIWFVVVSGPLVAFAAPTGTKKNIRLKNDSRASFLVESGLRWAELRAVHFNGHCRIMHDEELIKEFDQLLDEKYRAFRTQTSEVPKETQARYASRTLYQFQPDVRILSWDNSRIPLSTKVATE